MKKMINLGCGIFFLFLFSACSGQLHSSDRDYDQNQQITVPTDAAEKGPVTANNILVNNFYLGKVESQNNTGQKATNSADLDAAAGLNGGTGSNAAEGALALLDGVVSKFDGHQDASKKDSDNSTDNSTKPAAPTDIDQEAVKSDEEITPMTGTYNSSNTYPISIPEGHTTPFTWLNDTGSAYGGQIKLSWEGCQDLIVPDASKSHSRNGNINDHNQAIYFCGTDFPADSPENSGNRASVFADPGCMATAVTIHYNKPKAIAQVGNASQHNKTEVITMAPYKGKSLGWLTNHGAAYGKDIDISFQDRDCGGFTVADGAVSQGFYGEKNFNQTYYYNGSDTDWPEQTNGNRAGIMTRIGCVAKTATLAYYE